MREFGTSLDGVSTDARLPLARVQLSTDRVLKSAARKNVPPVGSVPGG